MALLIGERFTACQGHFGPRIEPHYQLNKRLGGPQNQSPYFGEKKNLLPLLGFRPPPYKNVPRCSQIVNIFRSLHVKMACQCFFYMAAHMMFISKIVHFPLFYSSLSWLIQSVKLGGVTVYARRSRLSLKSETTKAHVEEKNTITLYILIIKPNRCTNFSDLFLE